MDNQASGRSVNIESVRGGFRAAVVVGAKLPSRPIGKSPPRSKAEMSEGGAEVAGGELGGNGVDPEPSHRVRGWGNRGQFNVPMVVFREAPPFVIAEAHAGVGRCVNNHFDGVGGSDRV